MARVIVIERLVLVQQAITACLQTAGDHDVVAVETSAKALALASSAAADLALVAEPADASPRLMVEDLKRADPLLGIAVLAGRCSSSQAHEAFSAGAKAYLLLSDSSLVLTEALAAVEAGRRFVSPAARELLGVTAAPPVDPEQEDLIPLMTPREREMVVLLAQGLTCRAIAGRLGLNQKTVEAHSRRLRERLCLPTLAHVTRFAIREGLWID